MSNWELAVYNVIPSLPATEDDRHGYRLLVATAFSLQLACRSIERIREDNWSRALRGDELAEVMKHPISHGNEYDESLALFSSGYYVNNAQTRIHAALVRIIALAAGDPLTVESGVFRGLVYGRLKLVLETRTIDAELASCVKDLIDAFDWATRTGLESLLPTEGLAEGVTTIDDAHRKCELTAPQCAALTCMRSEMWLSCGHHRVVQTVPSAYAIEWIWGYRALQKVALMWKLLLRAQNRMTGTSRRHGTLPA